MAIVIQESDGIAIEGFLSGFKANLSGYNGLFYPVDGTGCDFGHPFDVHNNSTEHFGSGVDCAAFGLIQTSIAGQETTIFVLGVASSEKSEKQQWVMSARRAAAVADFIKSKRQEEAVWHIYSCGAGPGGDWVGQKGIVSEQTEIMIAILTK